MTLDAPLSRADDADVVCEWNQLVKATTTVGAPLTPRNFAIMHIAMFDAINSIEDGCRSFRFDNDASQLACPQFSEYVHDRLMRPKSG